MSLKTSCLTLLALLGKDALKLFDPVGALLDDGLCMFDDELCCVIALKASEGYLNCLWCDSDFTGDSAYVSVF